MKAAPDNQENEARARMRDLILRFGWNTTCYQLLNPGIRYWFSNERDAGVGYVEYAGTRIVAGSPVCKETDLLATVEEFENDAARHGLKVCYFATESRLESYIEGRPGYSTILLGGQPVWDPATLAKHIEEKQSLRMQISRSTNKGVIVQEWSAARATNHPALGSVLQEWLATRGLPSMHFLVEPDTLHNLSDRRIFVATRMEEVIGFVNLSPIPTRDGWLVEQFVRGRHAVNGTIEVLLYHAAKSIALDGSRYLTLGLSPLTSQAGEQPHRTPPFIRFLLYWAREHGKRFYNFAGLESFKSKFDPDHWEPIYAIANTTHFTLRSLIAIGYAFTNGKPYRTIILGIAKAVREELRRIRRAK